MQKVRILLVDDNRAFLSAAQGLLATLPEVEIVGCATSGQEALDEVARLAPDLVLMDVMMPGMNGFETARLIRAPGVAPQVVIVTLHDSAEYHAAALRSGARALVSKHEFATAIPRLVATLGRGDAATSKTPSRNLRNGDDRT